MIRRKYRYQLFVDELPNATLVKNKDTGKVEADFREGIYVGKKLGDNISSIIYNHLEITVKVHHVTGGDEVRVVGFEVQPFSIANGSPLTSATLKAQPQQYIVKK